MQNTAVPAVGFDRQPNCAKAEEIRQKKGPTSPPGLSCHTAALATGLFIKIGSGRLFLHVITVVVGFDALRFGTLGATRGLREALLD